MNIGHSGVGCSVVTLQELSDPNFQGVKRFRDDWTHSYYWDVDWSSKPSNVYKEDGSGVKGLVSYLKKVSPTGVVIFADNETRFGHGSKLAKWLRHWGYRVDESEPYVNENHRAPGTSKRDADKCVLYTWYWQAKAPNREETKDESVERQSSDEPVRKPRGIKENNRSTSKAPAVVARPTKRQATRKAA